MDAVKFSAAAEKRGSWPLTFFPAFMALPSLVAIFADRGLWEYDPSEYGLYSIRLFNTLLESPSRWPGLLFTELPRKAPLMAWLGQFFVPVGRLLGSVDRGLILSVVLTQGLALVLLFLVLRETYGKVSAALAGCLAMASAPLFAGMSTRYYVEPLQMLAVVWFLFIMNRARSWDGLTILFHLMAASALAMMVKISSPLYCYGPGLVALTLALRQGRQGFAWQPGRHAAPAAASALAVSMGGLWYLMNWSRIVGFVTHDVVLNPSWGREDTFPHKLLFWLGSMGKDFFIPVVSLIFVLLLAAALIFFLGRKARPGRGDLVALIAFLQILLVLSILSSIINESNRYLLPLLPYVGVLVAWALSGMNRGWPGNVALLLLVCQLLAVQAVRFGVIDKGTIFKEEPSSDMNLSPLDRDGRKAALQNEIVGLTRGATGEGRLIIVGEGEPVMALRFLAEKSRAPGGAECQFLEAVRLAGGEGPEEAAAGEAWEGLLSRRPAFYLDAEPGSYQAPAYIARNGGTLRKHRIALRLLERVRSSRLFERIPVDNHPEILFFKRHGEAPA